MRTFLLIAFLLLPAFGQEAIKPVRVNFTATTEEAGEEVGDAVREKLRGLGYVIMNTRHPQWRIVLAAAKDKCGYISALVVMDATGKSELSIHTAPDAESLTAQILGKIETEYFHPKSEGR